MKIWEEKVSEQLRGAWRGSGLSGLLGLSCLFGSTNERNKIDQINKINWRSLAGLWFVLLSPPPEKSEGSQSSLPGASPSPHYS
jgi:hypothetical protein